MYNLLENKQNSIINYDLITDLAEIVSSLHINENCTKLYILAVSLRNIINSISKEPNGIYRKKDNTMLKNLDVIIYVNVHYIT